MRSSILPLLVTRLAEIRSSSAWLQLARQSRITLSLGLFGLMLACGGGQVIEHPEPGVTGEVIPMTVKRGQASVKVVINGQTLSFLLDSGADQNVITAHAAAQLGLPLSTQTVVGNGAAGSYGAVHWIDISEVRIGSARLPHQAAFVLPSFPEGAPFDGLLGHPFFEAFIVQMDYQQEQMRLFSSANFVAPAKAAALPIQVQENMLLVKASAAGVSGWYVVDTGAAGQPLTMFTSTVDTFGLRTLSPRLRIYTGVGAGGAMTEGDLVRIPEFRLGPFQLNNVITELSLATEGAFAHPRANTWGNLGAELWRRFTVTFDYKGGTMYLQPNDSFTLPFDAPRSGLIAPLDHGKMKVIQIIAASPAEYAGVQVGDIIVSAELAGIVYQTPESIGDALRAAAGSTVTLKLLSTNGIAHAVRLVLRDLL